MEILVIGAPTSAAARSVDAVVEVVGQDAATDWAHPVRPRLARR